MERLVGLLRSFVLEVGDEAAVLERDTRVAGEGLEDVQVFVDEAAHVGETVGDHDGTR